MLRFHKPIHPVVLYERYLICIFIKIHGNLNKKGGGRKSIKNYKPGGVNEVVILPCTPRAFICHAKLISGAPTCR